MGKAEFSLPFDKPIALRYKRETIAAAIHKQLYLHSAVVLLRWHRQEFLDYAGISCELCSKEIVW